MSTSEMRRGPGWWMDLDGQWKPPQEWPESTPPLPGWTRNADGLWSNDVLQNLPLPQPDRPAFSVQKPDAKPARNIIDLTDGADKTNNIGIEPDTRPSLTYSEVAVTSVPVDDDFDRVFPKRALTAALAAAAIAAMLAAGIVLLILL